MNANATAVAIATSIATVKAVVKRGENVFNAYMISSIRFNWWLVGLARLGCSLSALLLSIVTNGVIASSRYGCTIRTQTKGVNFFLKFFFVGRVGVGGGGGMGERGCGCVGVGAWVGGWGGRDGDGRARDGAGWIGIVAVGWARIGSCRSTNPDSDCRLVCDR